MSEYIDKINNCDKIPSKGGIPFAEVQALAKQLGIDITGKTKSTLCVEIKQLLHKSPLAPLATPQSTPDTPIITKVPTTTKIIKLLKIPTTQTKYVMQSNAEAGVFIHWGVYSIPAFSPRRKTVPKTGVYNGSEWYLGRLKNTFLYKYDTRDYHEQNYGPFVDSDTAIGRYYDFIDEFEQAASNWFAGGAQNLVDKIKATGAQYVIMTAKHHDGICLYPSKYGLYHTKRDYIRELQIAAKKAGLQFGVYYSLMEWTPLYSTGAKKISTYVNTVLQPQLMELVTLYQPDILWADGHWQHTTATWKSIDFLDKLFSTSNTVTNDRWGKDFFEVVEAMSLDKRKLYQSRCYLTGADRLMPVQGNAPTHLWEHVNTISNSWGYAKNQLPSDYKSNQDVLNLYQQVHKAGGRFTINVGLKSDGTLDPLEEKTLLGLNFA